MSPENIDSDNEAQLRIDRMLDEEKRPLDSRSEANAKHGRSQRGRAESADTKGRMSKRDAQSTEVHPPYGTDRDAEP